MRAENDGGCPYADEPPAVRQNQFDDFGTVHIALLE
jgi:hypothetical protein